jgi:hypothetical protein
LGERCDATFALVPDLHLPGTLPWHAFRAILAAWPDALTSNWNKVAVAYVDAHYVPNKHLTEEMQRRRRHDLTEAILTEIKALHVGGWA